MMKKMIQFDWLRTGFIFPLWLFAILVSLMTGCQKPAAYVYNEGQIYGSFYHVVYESPGGKDIHDEIKVKLNDYNQIFSTYDSTSVISKVNRNEPVELDSLFIYCFNRSMEISALSDGAFDLTVGPLVNAWGFGFKHKENITEELIDSLLNLTGYRKIRIEDGKVVKEHPNVSLDVNAVAPGYIADLLGRFLASKGCRNYMVEIGGEVVAKGINAKGLPWSIGISKPDETAFYSTKDLQAVVRITDKAVATSGNYRSFYVENGKKYAHTIDPKTGYPVQHSLLSATVIAQDGITADAVATVFMVIGLEKGVELSKQIPGIDVYFIYSDESGFNKIYMSDNFKNYLAD